MIKSIFDFRGWTNVCVCSVSSMECKQSLFICIPICCTRFHASVILSRFLHFCLTAARICYNLLRDITDIIIIVIISFNRVHVWIFQFSIYYNASDLCVFCSILLINSVCCCCIRWFSVDNGVKYDASRAYLSDLNVTENIWIGLMRSQNSDRFMWS